MAAEYAAQKAALPVKALPRSHSPNDSHVEQKGSDKFAGV